MDQIKEDTCWPLRFSQRWLESRSEYTCCWAAQRRNKQFANHLNYSWSQNAIISTISQHNSTINNTKKSKGVSTYIAKHEIKHDDDMHTMNRNKQLSWKVVSLRSHDNMVRTIKNPQFVLNSVQWQDMQVLSALECVRFGYKL